MRLIGSVRRPVATFCLCAGMLLVGDLAAQQASAPRGAAGARPEVTFLHISDQHYGAKNFDPTILEATIDAMNTLAGTPYPDAVGGVVGTPRGVIMTGDLTDGGAVTQWQGFFSEWGLTGKEGRLHFPVYEGAGNHDGGPSTRGTGDGRGFVRRQISERNRTRPGVVNRSTNGLHYSWDWEDLHLVCLNEYAGTDGEERYAGNPAYNRKMQQYGNPAEQSLQFLREDLAARVGKSGRPVILTQHYGFDGFSFHPWGEKASWWTEEHALRLWETIEGYNVIAILNGHDGSESIFDWHGIKNYHMDDTVRFGVYRVSGDRMTVAQRNSKTGTWETSSEQSTRINSSLPPELAWGPYLMYNGDPGEMTIAWRCHTNVPVKLHWGKDYFRYENPVVEVKPADGVNHRYNHSLSGLAPDSRINFALEINGKYAPGMFYTQPASSAAGGTNKVKFLAIGGLCTKPAENDRLYQAMYEKIYEDAAYHTFLLHTGPFAANESSLADWDKGFFARDPGAKHARYIQSRLPILGATASPKLIAPFNQGKPGSHSFNYGPVHAAVLDLAQDWSPGSGTHEWLKADLASTTNTWKVLVLGRPAPGQNAQTRISEVLKQLQPLCEATGVDVCFDGWERGFSHAKVNGVMHVTLGNGGEATRTATTTSSDPAPFYCAITVVGDELTLQALGSTGSVIDTFSMKDMPGSAGAGATAVDK